MNKMFKRITATAIAAVISTGMLSIGASAYEAVQSWRINFMNHAPSSQPGLTPVCYSTIPVYGNGYQTNCLSITGANDRYVGVKAPGITEFKITSTGLSAVKRCEPSGYDITFTFYGVADTSCIASGSVGYNK